MRGVPYHQHISLDNSIDIHGGGTSFTVRGTHNSFQHLYEHGRAFKGKTPMHYLSASFNSCDATALSDAFKVSLDAAYPPEDTRSVRKEFEIAISSKKDVEKEKPNVTELVFVWEREMSILISKTGDYYINLQAMVQTDEDYEKLSVIFEGLKETFEEREEEFERKFYMITHDGNGLDLLEYDVNSTKIEGFNVDLLYNDSFKDAAEKIETTLALKDGATGIVLLHGIYGSGKTTYLRHLICTLNKRIIYMPPDMANQLGSPSFFHFIRSYPNSILIIEDAENILKKRVEGGSAAIANILNLSDGIMGDALKIQVVCTFNAELAEIDEALLRPGRLIAKYHFDVLSKAKTLGLVKSLYGEDAVPLNDQMTVAEIYRMKEKLINTKKEKPSFGFSPK